MGIWTNSNRSKMGSTVYTDQNQGGGDKKAGFPYQVGRGWQTSIAFNNTNVVMGHCCTLTNYQTLLFTFPVSQVRGVGVDVRIPIR
jgi:hypothetical protein